LLADRDPEEARQILDPVLERLMTAVHRYEDTVNQVMGDGIMALFGAPLAHEDHAVRACYAALHMQEAIGRYAEELRRQQGLDVQIRVGLNSGAVVVRAILLKAYFGIEVHDDARKRREKVTGKLLTLERALEPTLPAFLALLEVPVEVEDQQWQALDPLGASRCILDLLYEAETLAEALGDQRRLGQVGNFMTTAFHVLGDLNRALTSGQRALSIAEALGDFFLQVRANFVLGAVHYSLGDYRRAINYLERKVESLVRELLYERFGLA